MPAQLNRKSSILTLKINDKTLAYNEIFLYTQQLKKRNWGCGISPRESSGIHMLYCLASCTFAGAKVAY